MTTFAQFPPWYPILPTRVRRGYTGGAEIARWTGGGEERDTSLPEDWIASTTVARNPGLPPLAGEGLTRVRLADGNAGDLRAEVARAPEYLLGAKHLAQRGQELGFLAKLLDAAIRLHIQAHPTAAFAQAHLNSRYGKLETYVILGVRPGCEAYALLGFREPPPRAEWRRIIAEQDLAAMQACLHRVPLRPGEVWLVPGGLPHAIGEGVLMLEVMEPSDWVVRCEFERGGIVVPPEARFMGRDLDFCLDVFDYRTMSEADVRRRCQLSPRVVAENAAGREEQLVGPAHTDCFAVHRLEVRGDLPLPQDGRIRLLLVTAGEGVLEAEGNRVELKAGARLIVPAGSTACRVRSKDGTALQAVLCLPGAG